MPKQQSLTSKVGAFSNGKHGFLVGVGDADHSSLDEIEALGGTAVLDDELARLVEVLAQNGYQVGDEALVGAGEERDGRDHRPEVVGEHVLAGDKLKEREES